ncbi:Hypothetical protein GbCGDNIH3_7212 [Granulibacter bethesdensis]|uniref:Uncharacterized protein n=1 Tax=Granulibacter bethesdensis TaxID=364410 RepID=A0AAN0RBK0_9PROT|nr:Hypothetical protein GbCGDNIH3_7212 [Granulibacter bethesdensis]
MDRFPSCGLSFQWSQIDHSSETPFISHGVATDMTVLTDSIKLLAYEYQCANLAIVTALDAYTPVWCFT